MFFHETRERKNQYGPWMYLYLTSDNGDFNEFSFESYGKQQEFEEFC